jgi:hypothetical protein
MKPGLTMSSSIALAFLVVAPAHADVSAGRPKYPDAKAAYPFVVKVRNFHGAEGFGFDYYLAPDSLTVVAWDDFGSKPKEVLHVVLSAADTARWSAFLAAFPVAKLAANYTNAGVADGLQLWFDFRIAGKPPKQIFVGNSHQDDLERVCMELNKLLPAPLKLPRLRDPSVDR